MEKDQLIESLMEQLRLSAEREKSLMEQLTLQSAQIHQQSIHIQELTSSIRSLEEALLSKKADNLALEGKNRGLGKLLSNKSEKVAPAPEVEQIQVGIEPQGPFRVDLKERGNNNSKRKEYFDMETILQDIYPNDPGFDKEKSRVIGYVDSITYKYYPARFVKIIYRQYNCVQDEKIYSGKAPRTPLLNSNYDGSFIAGMLQLRYIYSMPVERIVKYFTEHGFEMSKSTAHGLIKKSALMMERLDLVLKKTILEDDYLSMDESYYTILTKEKNSHGKGVRKGYIWAALANTSKLVQYFYEDGSRSRNVLTNYIGEKYKGAIQSDGLANYKILETDAFPHIIRLACFQHCKRQFLDLDKDNGAIEIVDIINSLYRHEHKIDKDCKTEDILNYRQEYAPPILKKLKDKLLAIQSDPATLPKSPLSKAVNYTLGEYDALCNYILRHDYKPDNNAIERQLRYISLSRRNSLFCGSHAGAERTALIYSLACSCRLNGINTFEYFTDILNKLAYISHNASDEVFKELLPNRWMN
jgi:transposase